MLTVDVDDGKTNEIVRELKTLRDMAHDHFNAFEIEYLDGNAWTKSRVYLRRRFLRRAKRSSGSRKARQASSQSTTSGSR